MKRVIAATILALGIAGLGASQTASAYGYGYHGYYGPRVGIGINLGFPLYADPYYPYYYPVAPAVVYATPPTTVVAVPAATPASQVVYQYYCASSNDYYPHVPTCAQPWMKVVPDGSATY